MAEEPRISGQPEVVGWFDRFDAPILEVPLSFPPDWMWMAAHEQLVNDEGYPVSHQITIETDETKIILGCATNNVNQTLNWLEDHMDKVAQRASRIRTRAREAQSVAAEWWTEKNL